MDIQLEIMKQNRLKSIESFIELIIKSYDKEAYEELISFLKIMPNDIDEIAIDEKLFKKYIETCHQISNRALDRKVCKAIEKIKNKRTGEEMRKEEIKITFHICSFYQLKETIKHIKELKKEHPDIRYSIEIKVN